MTPRHYLVPDVFLLMTHRRGGPSGVLLNAAVSMDLAAVAHVNKPGFFKQLCSAWLCVDHVVLVL